MIENQYVMLLKTEELRAKTEELRAKTEELRAKTDLKTDKVGDIKSVWRR